MDHYIDLTAYRLNRREILKQHDLQCSNSLHLALSRHNLKIAQKLILNGANVNFECAYGLKPLHILAFEPDLQTAKLLVEHGAIVDSKSRRFNSMTPLHFCLSSRLSINTEKMFTFLIEEGADINAKCILGRTAMSIAAHNNEEYYVDILIENGANLDYFKSIYIFY